MLNITIDLIPFGLTTHTRTLRTLRITNTGKGTKHKGDYIAEFIGEKGGVYRRVEITGFPRKRKGPWDLVYEALTKLKEGGVKCGG
jgi:hypothetical protein